MTKIIKHPFGTDYDVNLINKNRIFISGTSQTIANTTTETTIFGTGVGTKNVIENYGSVAGNAIRITSYGHINTVSGTLAFTVKKGSTLLANTGGYTPATGQSQSSVKVEAMITFLSSTSIIINFMFWYKDSTSGSYQGIGTANTSNVSSLEEALNITAQWGVANPSNSITFNQSVIEYI